LLVIFGSHSSAFFNSALDYIALTIERGIKDRFSAPSSPLFFDRKLSFSKIGFYASSAQPLAQRLTIIAFIGYEHLWPESGPASSQLKVALLEQALGLGDFIALAAGQLHLQRHAPLLTARWSLLL
jgi:hypothetical protein